MKVLRALGLEQALSAKAFEAEQFEGRDWKTGEVLFQTPMKDVSKERYGAGHYQIHRSDLLEILASAVGDSAVTLYSRCRNVEVTEDRTFVEFAGGQQLEFDLVIGADGLHSVVRSHLHGTEAPRFTGHMCWRALIPSTRLPARHIPPQMTIWKGPNGHVVTYLLRGGAVVNLVAFLAVAREVEESWSTKSTPAELASAYPDVHPDLRRVLESVDECFKWGLYDREPLTSWSIGRATLLGDAAHPMLPFLGQGAACAIEDGYVLARELATTPHDIGAALRQYEAIRLPRTSSIQLAARTQERFAHQATRTIPINSDWLYEHDVTSK